MKREMVRNIILLITLLSFQFSWGATTTSSQEQTKADELSAFRNKITQPLLGRDQFNKAKSLLQSGIAFEKTTLATCRTYSSALESHECNWKDEGFYRDFETPIRVVHGDVKECRSFLRDTDCRSYMKTRPWARLPGKESSCIVRDVVRTCVYIRKALDLCQITSIFHADRWLVTNGGQIPLVDRNRDSLLDELSSTMGKELNEMEGEK